MANMSKPSIGETADTLFHDQHFELEECMRNPIAFHAEMMGDIMYFQQAPNQTDVEHSVKAVVKEVNHHESIEIWCQMISILYPQFGPCAESAT